MNKKMLYLTTLLVCAVALNSCDEPKNDNSILGTWHVDTYTSLAAPSYTGDWEINDDGTQHLDFINTGGIMPPRHWYLSGSYHMLSDSIMIVTTLEGVGLEYNSAFQFSPDTLFIDLHRSGLKTSRAITVAPTTFERVGTVLEWEKK